MQLPVTAAAAALLVLLLHSLQADFLQACSAGQRTHVER
jgi:hypothetical protein